MFQGSCWISFIRVYFPRTFLNLLYYSRRARKVLSGRILPFWNMCMANKNNHSDIIVHVKFKLRSVPVVVNYGKCSFTTSSVQSMGCLLLTFFKVMELLTDIFFLHKIYLLSKNFFLQNTIFHEQVLLKTALKLNITKNTVHNSLQYGTCALFTTPPQNMQHVCYNWYPRPILNNKINVVHNYRSLLHMKLTSLLKISQIGNFTGILSFTQSINIPQCTNVLSFHSTSNVATLPVLISYECSFTMI